MAVHNNNNNHNEVKFGQELRDHKEQLACVFTEQETRRVVSQHLRMIETVR